MVWMVLPWENPNLKWMMTGGTPRETSGNHHVSVVEVISHLMSRLYESHPQCWRLLRLIPSCFNKKIEASNSFKCPMSHVHPCSKCLTSWHQTKTRFFTGFRTWLTWRRSKKPTIFGWYLHDSGNLHNYYRFLIPLIFHVSMIFAGVPPFMKTPRSHMKTKDLSSASVDQTRRHRRLVLHGRPGRCCWWNGTTWSFTYGISMVSIGFDNGIWKKKRKLPYVEVSWNRGPLNRPVHYDFPKPSSYWGYSHFRKRPY